MNPHDNSNTSSGQTITSVEGGIVVSAKSHVEGDDIGHHVKVKPYSMAESKIASVSVGQCGDAMIPMEGQQVLVGYRRDERPVVLDSTYGVSDTVPEFEPGERRIGHPSTDSHVELQNDGSVTITGDSGATVEIQSNGDVAVTTDGTVDVNDGTFVVDDSGTVTVNDGATAPITDVETSTDADGHVTSIELTRADGVFVPSQ